MRLRFIHILMGINYSMSMLLDTKRSEFCESAVVTTSYLLWESLLQNATANLFQNSTKFYHKMRRFYFKMRWLLQNAKFITKYAVTHHSTSLEGISASSYIIFLSYCNDGIASDRFNFYDLLKYIVSYRGFQIQKKSIFISNNLIVLPCAYLEIHLRPCACNM